MSNPHLPAVLEAIDTGLDASLERLFDLMRIPSVSTEQAHAQDCRDAAEWLARELSSLDYVASLEQGAVDGQGGHPIVVARGGPEDGPRALFYGHYDVQPVDPLELWDHPPFEPMIEARADGTKIIRGRGSSDDKGQLLTFVEACRAWRSVAGAPPIGVTFVLEGEEEAGGETLSRYLDNPGDMLGADLALVCDTTMWGAARPAISTSLRGVITTTLSLKASNTDLHSGHYGSAARNPLAVLAKILADLRDDQGAVTLAGFYDGAPEAPEDIRAIWDGLGFDPKKFLGDIGLSEPAGETNRSVLEQIWARPTAEINGVWGGYTGDGFKTVIPAEAHAKISFRLVGDQNPQAIFAALKAHIEARLPPDCRYTLTDPHIGEAISLPYDSASLRAASSALADEWSMPAALIGMGGSIPVVGEFKRKLGLDSLLVGFAQEDDQIHAPNEKYSLTSYHKGIRSWARILAALAEPETASHIMAARRG